jgi:hypothetical protein
MKNVICLARNPLELAHQLFDGHPSIEEAINFWSDMPEGSIAFTPLGWEIDKETVLAFASVCRVIFAAENLVSDNGAWKSLSTGDPMDCQQNWLISTEALRQLQQSLND